MLSYRATVLLTPDEATDPLISILSKKTAIITRLIFEVSYSFTKSST